MTRKKHYAWVILVGCCLMNCGVSGIINAVGLFYSPVSADLGLTITEISSTRTLQSIVSAFFLVIFSSKLLKLNYKKLLIASSAVHGCCWLFMALCTKLYHFYIVSVFMGCSLAVLQSLAVSITLNTWFNEKRGLAFSIAASASGVSGIAISAATGEILEKLGWHAGYIFFGIIALALPLFSSIALLKASPSGLGLEPYGGAVKKSEQQQAGGELSAKSVFCNPMLYVILFLYAVFSFCTTTTVHTSNYATSIGFGIMASALISSLGLAGNTVGKLLIGFVRDKIGTAFAAALNVGAVITGFLLLVLSPNEIRLYIGVFLVGSAMALPTVIAPVLLGDFFFGQSYSRVLPVATMVGSLVGASGNTVFGLSFDATGGYTQIFTVCLLLLSAALCVLMVVGLRAVRKKTFRGVIR